MKNHLSASCRFNCKTLIWVTLGISVRESQNSCVHFIWVVQLHFVTDQAFQKVQKSWYGMWTCPAYSVEPVLMNKLTTSPFFTYFQLIIWVVWSYMMITWYTSFCPWILQQRSQESRSTNGRILFVLILVMPCYIVHSWAQVCQIVRRAHLTGAQESVLWLKLSTQKVSVEFVEHIPSDKKSRA